jgi:hypothetical protein
LPAVALLSTEKGQSYKLSRFTFSSTLSAEVFNWPSLSAVSFNSTIFSTPFLPSTHGARQDGQASFGKEILRHVERGELRSE